MKKITLFLVFCLFQTQAQVGINTSSPDASAMLDVQSSDKGFLPPRVANTSAVSNPAAGLIVYDMSDDILKTNSGTPSAPVWSNLHAGGVTTVKVIDAQAGVFENGGFGNNCTPQAEFSQGTYFSLNHFSGTGGNNYCLPNPSDVRGRVYYIRNIGNTNDIFLAVPNGDNTIGFCFGNANACTNFLRVGVNDVTKTVQLISDGVNYTVIRD